MISKDRFMYGAFSRFLSAKHTVTSLHNGREGEKDDISAVVRAFAGLLYDTVLCPEIEMKIVRSKEAKEFPIIGIKKDGDVGYDLPSIIPEGEVLLQPHQMKKVATGIKFQIPDGYWIELKARSGTGQLMVLTPDAVIDEKYRGEIFPCLINVGTSPVMLHHGDRFIQAIIHKKYNDRLTIVEVDKLDESERGESGFNSTGRGV